MKNYQIILTAILSFGVGISILNGTAQQYVYFAGELNELGCTVIALTMGVLSLYALDWKGFFNYLNK
jgi:fucose permease